MVGALLPAVDVRDVAVVVVVGFDKHSNVLAAPISAGLFIIFSSSFHRPE